MKKQVNTNITALKTLKTLIFSLVFVVCLTAEWDATVPFASGTDKVYAASKELSSEVAEMSLDEVKNRLKECEDKGDYKTALIYLKAYVEKDTNGYAYYSLGNAYFNREEYWDAGATAYDLQKAEECYLLGAETAKKNNTNYVACNYEGLGKVYEASHNYYKAREYYNLTLDCLKSMSETDYVKSTRAIINEKLEIFPKLGSNTPQISSVKNNKKGSAVISLKKDSKLAGVYVQWSTSPEFSTADTKVKEVYFYKKNYNFNLRRLNKGKTYYIKMHGMGTDKNGDPYCTDFSDTIKIKIKK